jgi:hypothetical protein
LGEEVQSKYPEKIDLNFQNCRAVKSRKTQEDLLVLEAKDYKTGIFYSIWIRKDGISKILTEIAKMIG